MAETNKAGDFWYAGLPRYVTALEDWFYSQQRIAFDNAILPDGKWRLCLGVLVYGAYVDRFLRFCVPSLLAPGNVGALPDPLIIVHTDAASVERIEAGLSELRRVARIEVHVVPQAIIAMVPENTANKYWLLGGAHNLHMQQAKYRAHAYHMLMPDHVYGMGYFANLARLAGRGERAIVQGGISANIDTVDEVLDAAGGEIEPERLTALALDNLHPLLLPFLMNGRDDYPISLLLVMIGEKSAHIVSPHMSIAYLAHEVLMRAPLRLLNTVDGQLPFFIPEDIAPYVPVPDDRMSYAELSDGDKDSEWRDGCTLIEFCARFWIMSYCCRGYERFFALTTELRFPEWYVPPMPPMADDEIAALKARVRTAVAENYETLFKVLPERHRIDPIQWLIEHENDASQSRLCQAVAARG